MDTTTFDTKICAWKIPLVEIYFVNMEDLIKSTFLHGN